MFSLMLNFESKWPWVSIHKCWVSKAEKEAIASELVRMPSGEIGVIDHVKPDGRFGVRPINPDGEFLPNEALDWSYKQRMSIPKEVSLALSDIKPIETNEIPLVFLTKKKSVPPIKNRLFR